MFITSYTDIWDDDQIIQDDPQVCGCWDGLSL